MPEAARQECRAYIIPKSLTRNFAGYTEKYAQGFRSVHIDILMQMKNITSSLRACV